MTGRAGRYLLASVVGFVLAGLGPVAAQSPFQYMTPTDHNDSAGAPQSAPARTPSSGNIDVKEIIRAAERGDVTAEVRASSLFLSAWLHAQPQQKPALAGPTLKWARAAAEHGNAGGQANYGAIYELGVGLPINLAEAMKWYRLAADQGNPNAQSAVGRLYYTGKGVPQDYDQAREFLFKAAAQNEPVAENYLGIMYTNGRGVAKDPAEGVKWYRRAASQGNDFAQLNLGNTYANGNGALPDNLLAYFWYNVAAAHASGAVLQTADRLRDAAAQKLSSADVERAQHAARDWKPSATAADAVEAQLRGGGLSSTVSTAGGAAGTHAVVSTGTGFVITKAGHVLTNFHVVNGCSEMRGRAPGGRTLPGEVVAKDPQNDLAVVKLSSPLSHVASFRSGQPLRQGDGVVVYGFPFGDALAAEGNLTTGNVSALAGLANDSRQLQISAPVQPGNSGGPLVDMSGNVVGIIVAKLNALAMMKITGDVPQNINFAIKAGVAESFLEANGIAYQTAASGPAMGVSDVGGHTRQFTLKLECLR